MVPTGDGSGVDLVEAVNRRTGAGLTRQSRSVFGQLGGAVFVEWPDGRPAVVTVFHGSLAQAQRVAEALNTLQARGLPVPEHELVVGLDDHVVLVQQRLPDSPPRPLTPRRIDAVVEINDRFAAAAEGLADLPSVTEFFEPGQLLGPIPDGSARAEQILSKIIELTEGSNAERLGGDDVVHIDLSPVNVLFDDRDRATAVVDWNLGIFRGDRRLALVQTRFDREWFVQRADSDPTETAAAAAHHLDHILTARIDPHTLRVFWAYWLRHHLAQSLQRGDPTVIAWQLLLAESRLS